MMFGFSFSIYRSDWKFHRMNFSDALKENARGSWPLDWMRSFNSEDGADSLGRIFAK
jgi:hypothetical protein